jgi:hypothetical protein
LETQNITGNALTAHRLGVKGKKNQKKDIGGKQTAEQKTRTRGNPVVFPCLGAIHTVA